MRLDLVAFSRRRPLWLASLDRTRDGGQRAGGEGADLAGERQQPRGDAFQDAQRVGEVAWPVGAAGLPCAASYSARFEAQVMPRRSAAKQLDAIRAARSRLATTAFDHDAVDRAKREGRA